ncbi:MAG: helix-turn-helix transcriptional regulator, partial [Coriobacteriales bacterium]
IAVMASTFVVIYLLANKITPSYRSKLGSLSILTFVGIICSIVGNLLGSLPTAVTLICWALTGVGTAAMGTLWIIYLSSSHSYTVAISVGVGMAIGTVLFFAINMQTGHEILILVEYGLLAAFSLASNLFLAKNLGTEQWGEAKEEKPTKSSIGEIASQLSICMQGMTFGFATFFICNMGNEMTVIIFSLGIAGPLILVIWAITKPEGMLENSNVLQRWTVPILVACLASTIVIPKEYLPIPSTAITITLSLSMCFFWVISASMAFEFHRHPIRWFTSHQAIDWYGYAAGIFIAFSCSSSQLAITIATLTILVLLTIAFAGVSDDKANPDTLLADLAVGEQVDVDQSSIAKKGFQECCEELAEKYGLTKRETDVFLLLARGRNAKAIQKKLVISSSTAKTHIYSIYRKLGVRTQQDLIDLVEEATGDIS